MNITLMAHDKKKELMVQFCIAYCGILSRHRLFATGTTGKLVITWYYIDGNGESGENQQEAIVNFTKE